MVRQCSIKRCKSESFAGCGVSFHRLPLKEVIKQKWLTAMSNCLRNVKMPVVCSLHFRPEDYYQGRYRFKLREDAVPSIFPGIRNTRHETPVVVKTEPEEEETQLDNLSVTVTSVPSPKYVIQMLDGSPSVFGPMLVELKTEPDPMKTDENPPGVVEEALSFDEVGPLEDLVPLSAHPVPLSTAPDPLCDVKVKVEVINESAEEATGAQEDRGVGVNGGGLGTGTTLWGVAPSTADLDLVPTVNVSAQRLSDQRVIQRNHRLDDAALDRLRSEVLSNFIIPTQTAVQAPARGAITVSDVVDDRVVTYETRKIEQRIKNLSRNNGRDRARLRNVVKAIRRRDMEISELRERLAALGAGVGTFGVGVGTFGAGVGTFGAGIEETLALAGNGAKGDEISKKIYSIKKNERMKKANRQLLIIERQNSSNNGEKTSDIRQKSVLMTSDNRKKSSVQGNVGKMSDIRQKTLVGVKPTKNTLLVMQPIPDNTENSSTRTTLEVQQKSSVAKAKSNIQQEKSSDIPQTSVGVQRTSDIRQNTLVIQIDGMQSTVIPPKLVRLKDNDMDIG